MCKLRSGSLKHWQNNWSTHCGRGGVPLKRKPRCLWGGGDCWHPPPPATPPPLTKIFLEWETTEKVCRRTNFFQPFFVHKTLGTPSPSTQQPLQSSSQHRPSGTGRRRLPGKQLLQAPPLTTVPTLLMIQKACFASGEWDPEWPHHPNATPPAPTSTVHTPSPFLPPAVCPGRAGPRPPAPGALVGHRGPRPAPARGPVARGCSGLLGLRLGWGCGLRQAPLLRSPSVSPPPSPSQTSPTLLRLALCHPQCPPPPTPSAGALCYSMCTISCYRDELGANYSRIAPLFPDAIGEGGLVRNPRLLPDLPPNLPPLPPLPPPTHKTNARTAATAAARALRHRAKRYRNCTTARQGHCVAATHSKALRPRQGCIVGGGYPLPPPSRAPSLCPATVPLTPSASLNGICNRQ